MKKTTKLRIFRTIVQAAAFLAVPGVFMLTLGGLRQIFSSILAGNFDIARLLPQLTEVIVVIPLTILLGRFFCGWFCAFGAFTDFIHLAFRRMFKVKFKINSKLDGVFKKFKYFVLAFIIVFIWIGGNNLFQYISPWNAFARLIDFSGVSMYMDGLLILLIIAAGSVFVERFFCRYLCPLGAVFSLVAKARIFRISKPEEKCRNCGLCTLHCSMGLDLRRTARVDSGDCINCLGCTAVCPIKVPKGYLGNQELSAGFAGALAITAFTGLYAVSGLALTGMNIVDTQLTSSAGDSAGQAGSGAAAGVTTLPGNGGTQATQGSGSVAQGSSGAQGSGSAAQGSGSTVQPTQTSKFRDGTYIGDGYGHRPGLKVSVTIKSDKITDLQILSSRETPRFADAAYNTVPGEIMKFQSLQVDTVSGATETSNGIIEAVNNALQQAINA